jgi:hypothetical protein
MPSLERLEEPPRLELLDPDEALMPPSRLLELDELEPVEPLFEALRPPWPERSCELPRPEFVLPDAPRPSLREDVPLLLPAFEALYPDSFDEDESSLRVAELPMPSSPWLPRSVRLVPEDEPEDPDEPVEPADWLRPLWLF